MIKSLTLPNGEIASVGQNVFWAKRDCKIMDFINIGEDWGMFHVLGKMELKQDYIFSTKIDDLLELVKSNNEISEDSLDNKV